MAAIATSMSGDGLTVVVMCGSAGSRLFPLTIDRPKALLPVANRPVLAYLLDTLQLLAFAEVVLVTTEEFANSISQFLTTYKSGEGVTINPDIVSYPDDTGTADVLRKLKREDKLRGDSVLVLPGEVRARARGPGRGREAGRGGAGQS